MSLRVGMVVLPTDRWSDAQRQWTWVEDSGFTGAYTYDHLCWGGFPDGPWHGAYEVLSAAAGATSSIRLGTLVTSPNFRHPVPLARQVVTLDDLSDGRFDLGIGAGASDNDAAVLGEAPWPAGERSARLAEFVELLDGLLTGAVTRRQGTWYSALDLPIAPGCVQSPRVPFTMAAAGPRALALAARFGQRWVTIGPARGPRPADLVLAAVTQQCAELDAACEAIGRDRATMGRVLLWTDKAPIESVGFFEDMAGPYVELGFNEIVLHHPDQTGPYGGDPAVYAQIGARFGAP